MPRPIVAGNWKMNTSVHEAVRLTLDLKPLDHVPLVEKVICPPFVSLDAVSRVLEGSSIKLGAQNMYYKEKGAFTGEISPAMLAGMCQFVVLGHSERRQHFGESNELINLKVKAAFEVGLRPILCVGETLDQRERGEAAAFVASQVKACLDGLHNIDELVIAYEPIWAIGTGVPATPEIASEMMGGVIIDALSNIYGSDIASRVPLLYGGSVTPDNVDGFVKEECVHGSLVGGASLKADQFLEIVSITAVAKERQSVGLDSADR